MLYTEYRTILFKKFSIEKIFYEEKNVFEK